MAGNNGPGGGAFLNRIMRNAADIRAVEALVGGFTNQKTVTKKSDFGVIDGDFIDLIPGVQLFNVVEPIDLTPHVLRGSNVAIMGTASFQANLKTNSSNALINSNGDGYMIIQDLFCENASGPFLNINLGNTPLSFFRLDFSFFNGDPLNNGSGVGSVGTISDTDRIGWATNFMLGCVDGLIIDGTIGETLIQDSPFVSRSGAGAYTAIKVLSTATTDIFSLDNVRFTTLNESDRVLNFSPSATALTALRVNRCTHRGLGQFVAAASRQKTDPYFTALGNGGSTAPLDSQFTGNATFVGNTEETVIGAGNTGVMLPIGNGNDAHEVFNGDAFLESFTLLGSTTQTQRLRYDGLRPQTFKIEFHSQLSRGGGGTVFIGLALAVDPLGVGSPVVVDRSVDSTEVGNAASPGYTSMVIELNPLDEVYIRNSNNSNTNNITVNSGNWSIGLA